MRAKKQDVAAAPAKAEPPIVMSGKKKNAISKEVGPPSRWTLKTTDFYQTHLYRARSVLNILILNVDEYDKGEGRSDDETLFLSIQHAESLIRTLEKSSYEFHVSIEIGDLSLCLMWARALLGMLTDMIHADEWEIRISDGELSGQLAAAVTLVEDAITETEKIHNANVFETKGAA